MTDTTSQEDKGEGARDFAPKRPRESWILSPEWGA